MAAKRSALTGMTFGRLTVIGFHGMNKGSSTVWLTRCDCGSEKLVTASALRGGGTRSCGCMARESGVRAAKLCLELKRAKSHAIVLCGEKKCTACKAIKPLAEFNQGGGAAGRSPWCKPCLASARLRSEYGISAAEKRAMIAEQGGVCAIGGCGTAVDMKSGHVDHCHQSGQVRGVLCKPCNTTLGWMDENPRRIEGLAAYARQWKQLRLVPAVSR